VDDLSAAGNYDELINGGDDVQVVAFDERQSDEEPQIAEPAIVEPATLVGKHVFAKDTSRLLPHRQQQFSNLNDFELAMGMYCHIYGVDRTSYAAMRETLALLGNSQAKNLPNQLATLKDRVKKRFPLMDTRVADVPLRIEKMPTEKATRKLE